MLQQQLAPQFLKNDLNNQYTVNFFLMLLKHLNLSPHGAGYSVVQCSIEIFVFFLNNCQNFTPLTSLRLDIPVERLFLYLFSYLN